MQGMQICLHAYIHRQMCTVACNVYSGGEVENIESIVMLASRRCFGEPRGVAIGRCDHLPPGPPQPLDYDSPSKLSRKSSRTAISMLTRVRPLSTLPSFFHHHRHPSRQQQPARSTAAAQYRARCTRRTKWTPRLYRPYWCRGFGQLVVASVRRDGDD